MSTKRHKPEEIVSKLRQVEVLVGQGMPRIHAFRQVRISFCSIRCFVRNTYLLVFRPLNRDEHGFQVGSGPII